MRLPWRSRRILISGFAARLNVEVELSLLEWDDAGHHSHLLAIGGGIA
jgi:hypothetical protein